MNDHYTHPLIRLEVQGMRHAIQVALQKHLLCMDKDIQTALDNICTPENISNIVFDTAKFEIKAAIDAEIQKFYRYGDGRKVIQDAVQRKLREQA